MDNPIEQKATALRSRNQPIKLHLVLRHVKSRNKSSTPLPCSTLESPGFPDVEQEQQPSKLPPFSTRQGSELTAKLLSTGEDPAPNSLSVVVFQQQQHAGLDHGCWPEHAAIVAGDGMSSSLGATPAEIILRATNSFIRSLSETSYPAWMLSSINPLDRSPTRQQSLAQLRRWRILGHARRGRVFAQGRVIQPGLGRLSRQLEQDNRSCSFRPHHPPPETPLNIGA